MKMDTDSRIPGNVVAAKRRPDIRGFILYDYDHPVGNLGMVEVASHLDRGMLQHPLRTELGRKSAASVIVMSKLNKPTLQTFGARAIQP